MSKRNKRPDNIPDDGPTTSSPKVLLVSEDPNFKANTNYSDFDVSNSAKDGYDFYAFLDSHFNFAKEDSLQEIIDYLMAPSKSFLLGVYSDVYITDKEVSYIQHLPSFDYNLVRNKFIFNVPFVITKSLLPTFNENIKSLRLWDGFLSLVKKTWMFHIPKPLFKLDNAFDTTLISKDVDLINETHYQARSQASE